MGARRQRERPGRGAGWADPDADANDADADADDADRAAPRRRASPRLAFVSVVATLTPGGGSEDESSANAALAAEAAFWERWFAETMEGTRRRAEATGDGEGAKGEKGEKGDAADAINTTAAATPGRAWAPRLWLRGGFELPPRGRWRRRRRRRRAAFASLAASLLRGARGWLASEGCVRARRARLVRRVVAVAVLALFGRLVDAGRGECVRDGAGGGRRGPRPARRHRVRRRGFGRNRRGEQTAPRIRARRQ